MTDSQPVVNNFNIDAQSLVAWIANGERRAVISTLVQNGILHSEDGETFEALVYENWEDRNEENHQPSIKTINITYDQPVDNESK